jgi:hypothetical protein
MRGSLAVLIEQAGAMGNPDQGSGIVEHVHEQEAQHHDRESRLERAGEIELKERRRKRGRSRNDAAVAREPERNADQGHDHDPDQRPADDAARIERHDQDEAQQA